MRFKHFKPRVLTEADLQQLDELRMNPSSLRQFAASPESEGIMAGFEAELIFKDLGGSDDDNDDLEPDYDYDERARSIQGVIDFFQGGDYGGLSGRQERALQEGLDEKYFEWQDERMYDAWRNERDDLIREAWLREKPMEQRILEALTDGMDIDDEDADRIVAAGDAAPRFTKSSDQQEYERQNKDYELYREAVDIADGILDEDVEQTLEKEDGFYDEVLDEFRENFYTDDDSSFFQDIGLGYMSDIASEFSLDWPYMTGGAGSQSGGFDEGNAERLADDLSEKLGIKTKVSSGYHSAKRDNVTWIFEPDSSLEADEYTDMPVEIVSPPMPLEECLRQMENFFAWAESNGAYANQSTGFHMGVSLPGKGGDVDYVKLALFLGDEHVLESFGRASNTYAEAAMRKIKKRVRSSPDAVTGALDLMRHNLIELAQKALEISNAGFGKYTSINPQGATTSADPSKRKGAKYIEFRSAGGVDESGNMYFEDMDKLKNTLLRYAQAMQVASRPDLERKEYYKKLYKLISPPEGDPAIDLFARYTAGAIDANQLKTMWAEKQLANDPDGKGDWKLWNATNGVAVPGQEYYRYTKAEAIEKAKKELQPGSSMEDFLKAYKILPMTSATGDWEVYHVDTGETLEILHGFETKGAAADSVYDKYAAQGIGFNLRPADPEEPKRELSQREKLAKRIKAPKPTWNVVYRPTGRVVDKIINVSREEAQKLLPKVAQQHQFSDIDDLELQNAADALAGEVQPNVGQNFSNQLDNSRPPEGFLTQRPATGDYYEVRDDNDQVHGYLAAGPGTNADVALVVRRYINNLTGGNRAYMTYRSGDPVQATAPNGIPMWEVYERDSGHVVHAFADHDQTSAWATGQGWLRGIGAEDPSLFSVRPKMNA